ncbi:hypothetical protein [Haliangium sp.]|uniref:hypothetical protein n=1 Tax=Haliangium sp. TaxID=2663208 RepID=UPI003D104A2C
MRASLCSVGFLALVLAVGLGLAPATAAAFVGGAAGGAPGEVRAEAKVGLERGLIEPNENEDSWQDARWNLYTLGVSYNFGTVGPLLDVFVLVDGTFFTSPAEVNQRGPVPAERCLGAAEPGDRCVFYRDDRGGLAGLAVGFNLLHTRRTALGVTVQGKAPIGVNLDKFANPRVDYLGASLRLGVQLTDWLSYETSLYAGTGPFGAQNAQLAYTQLFGARTELSGYGLGLQLGTYVDGDITERFDDRYDAAYTSGAPEVRDRIRMARFGALVIPQVSVGKRASLRFTYLQKFFGYDAAATRYFEIGLSVAM